MRGPSFPPSLKMPQNKKTLGGPQWCFKFANEIQIACFQLGDSITKFWGGPRISLCLSASGRRSFEFRWPTLRKTHIARGVVQGGGGPKAPPPTTAAPSWEGAGDVERFVHVNLAPVRGCSESVGTDLVEYAKLCFFLAPVRILLEQSEVVFEERWINDYD